MARAICYGREKNGLAVRLFKVALQANRIFGNHNAVSIRQLIVPLFSENLWKPYERGVYENWGIKRVLWKI